MKWLTQHLVDDWKDAWKWASTWVAILFGLLSVGYDYLPAVHDYLPDGWAKYVAVLFIAARIYKQNKTPAS